MLKSYSLHVGIRYYIHLQCMFSLIMSICGKNGLVMNMIFSTLALSTFPLNLPRSRIDTSFTPCFLNTSCLTIKFIGRIRPSSKTITWIKSNLLVDKIIFYEKHQRHPEYRALLIYNTLALGPSAHLSNKQVSSFAALSCSRLVSILPLVEIADMTARTSASTVPNSITIIITPTNVYKDTIVDRRPK